MPFIDTPDAVAALTVDGTAAGLVTVADATPFFPGSKVWLNSTTQVATEFKIVKVTGNVLSLRAVAPGDRQLSYGFTNCSIWKVADAATVFQTAQIVAVELSNLAKL